MIIKGFWTLVRTVKSPLTSSLSVSLLTNLARNFALLFFFPGGTFQMEQLSDEEVEVREEEEEEEDDSDKEDQDLDKMFGAWLGELDKLTQVEAR